MPEIGEVAKLVHHLRKNLIGKTISSVQALEDTILYKDTSADLFKNAITKKKVVDAKQQGKYFWIEMSSPPHIVAHLGMTGWMNFSNDTNSYYKAKKEESSEWPPKFWKFILKTDEDPPQEVAFVDQRRLGRVRLVDCPGKEIRNNSPLKENGPDPVIDKEQLTEDWFIEKIKKKKVPVKAWLLDQANVSGVGNWVGDEILYHAKIHPEQYTNSLSDAQLSQLHGSLMHICAVAVETLGDSGLFPDDWLMKYRWDKGKKNSKLPNGQKIDHVKVGGRTSAFVPAAQKKTGPTADEVEGGASKKKAPAKEDDSEDEIPNGESSKPSKKRTVDSKPKNATPKKPVPKQVIPKEATPKKAIPKKPTPSKRKAKDKTKDEDEEDAEEESSFEEPEDDDDESDYESGRRASKKRKGAEKDNSDDDYGRKSSTKRKSKGASGARRRSTRNRG